MSSRPTDQKPRDPREDRDNENWKSGRISATPHASEYGATVAEAAATARDYVTDKASVIGDRLSDLRNTDIKEVANQAKDYARQNPGQAILISAAAGLVLGLLIRGSRR